MYEVIRTSDYLEHHGIKGMHWGIRRYQNSDGTLTEAGKRHYGTSSRYKKLYDKSYKAGQKYIKVYNKQAKKELKKSDGTYEGNTEALDVRAFENKKVAKYRDKAIKARELAEEAKKAIDPVKEKRKATIKKIAKTTATILAAYGAIKVYKNLTSETGREMRKAFNETIQFRKELDNLNMNLANFTMDDLRKLDLY